MNDTPFQDIVLNRRELRALRLVVKYGKVLPKTEQNTVLFDYGLVRYVDNACNGAPGYAIATRGRDYFRYCKRARKRAYATKRQFWITTAISVVSLLISAYALYQTL